MILYKRVKEYLISEIEKAKEGAMLPSHSFLMKKFNVCHLTVRKALADLEKDGLIFKKQGKGIFVRKKISVLSPVKILIVVPFNWKTDFYSSVPFMEKLVVEALEKNIHIHIFPFKDNRHELYKIVEAQKCNGVIWLMPWEKDLPAMEEIFEMGCHVMAINRILPAMKFSYVSTDHENGAYNTTRYLIDEGHRKIGFVGYIETSHIIQRYSGFRRALIESELFSAETGVVRAFIERPKDWVVHLKKSFERYLSSYHPTAIFVSGISILLNGVLPVLREKQLQIPQELEVVTYDEIPVDVKEKNVIHEISQPFYEMGKISIEKMEGIIKGLYPSSRTILQPDLLIKEKSENCLPISEQQKSNI